MIVRCGACHTQFEVPGPGKYSCPSCGSVNAVRAAGGSSRPGYGSPPPGYPPSSSPPPPPQPERPSPRIQCPSCEFRFIVGDIDVATCPNCGAEVPTGRGKGED